MKEECVCACGPRDGTSEKYASGQGRGRGSKDPRIREESNWRSDGGVEVNGNSCVHIGKHFNAACTPMCRNTPVLNDAISKRCFSKVLMANE